MNTSAVRPVAAVQFAAPPLPLPSVQAPGTTGAQPTPADREPTHTAVPSRPFAEMLRQSRLQATAKPSAASAPTPAEARAAGTADTAATEDLPAEGAAPAPANAARAKVRSTPPTTGKGAATQATSDTDDADKESDETRSDATMHRHGTPGDAANAMRTDALAGQLAAASAARAGQSTRELALAGAAKASASRIDATSAASGNGATPDAPGDSGKTRATSADDAATDPRASGVDHADDASMAALADASKSASEPPLAALRDASQPVGRSGDPGASAALALQAGSAPIGEARGGDAGTMQLTLPTPVDSPEFATAFGVQVSVLAQDGVQQAELHLNPTDMGPVSIHIVLDGSEARVDFGADLAATRHAIEMSLPELAGALRDAGFTLAGGGVSQHAGGRSGSGDPGASNTSRGIDGAAAAAQAKAPAATTRRISVGGVDLYA
jgi:flagellar hook-length control protein FliK